MDAPHRISWDLLPSELLERSFKQTSNVQMLLSLRLVSKAWKAAAPKAFPGCLRVKIQAADHGATKLANVCKSLPNTTSLELQSRHTFFDVSPISKFSKLSSLVLKHWSDKGSGYHLLDLAILPSSLRDLQIEHWTFDITTLQGFISIDITSLHLSKTRSRLADTYELLQHLPGLKELSLGEEDEWPRHFEDIFRLTAVTCLELHSGSLVSQPEEPLHLAALRKLKLCHIMMSQAWLRVVYASGAKDVEFEHCGRLETCTEEDVLPTSAAMLRSLSLYDTPLEFLPHEAPRLQNLTINSQVTHISEADSLAIANFTSLTFLWLSGLQSADLLPLRTVSLHGYLEAALTLLEPGSGNPFRDLHKISISVERSALEACCAALDNAEPERQLLETARFLQSLPSLEVVSGRSKIFLGFREGFNGWRTCVWKFRGDHVCSRPVCLAARQLWCKERE